MNRSIAKATTILMRLRGQEKCGRFQSIKNWNKKRTVILGIVIVSLFFITYVLGQLYCKWDKFNETVTTTFTLVGAIVFLIELLNTETLNESQFVMELNNQFISNADMSRVENDLEVFFYKFERNELTEEYKAAFKNKYHIESNERQALINYLVHLEGIATLLKKKILHIGTICDLIGYRYFIAMNNPIVQELEIIPYYKYYKGCIGVYDEWVASWGNGSIPMYEEHPLPSWEELEQLEQERPEALKSIKKQQRSEFHSAVGVLEDVFLP